MSVQIAMADGGTVEYDIGGISEIVPIGNSRGVPTQYRYTHPGGPTQPSFRLEFGVTNGIPVCTGIHIESKDEIPVRTRDLKLIHVDKMVASATAAVAFEPDPQGTGWRKPHGDQNFNSVSMVAGKKAVKGKPRTRRSADDVDLKLVADTWRHAAPGSKTEALMTVFFCSKATAARYKKRAVEAGFIDE
ncbi:hypothetical protein [Gordonia sputi]